MKHTHIYRETSERERNEETNHYRMKSEAQRKKGFLLLTPQSTPHSASSSSLSLSLSPYFALLQDRPHELNVRDEAKFVAVSSNAQEIAPLSLSL
jgi:hypothetical protein